ncbi:MAG: response regulator, partial [Bacteroidales bacterium]|nr:response regulator [Bacteroidales bacterium]
HNNREAYYSNIPAGRYDFKVRVTNADYTDVVAENSIRVVIEKPLWLSWWAVLIYLLCMFLIINRITKLRRQMKNEKLAKLKAQQEKEQEKKVNQMNMSFFANISHEFRTPLTMISGPVTQLQESSGMTVEDKRLLNIVQRNIRRMLRLVNQLLDFNKLENDTLKLKVKPLDLIAQLKNLTDIFQVTANEKGVTFRTYGLEDSLMVWADEDKLDKVCFNLLSNAMKFTQAGGKVEFGLDVISRDEAMSFFALGDKDVDMRYMKVVVKDSGQGIPEDQREKIFERYYQLDNQTRGGYNWGTGIGLYLAKSLAQMHHGYLKAGNRKDGPGAEFTLIIPISESSYSESEKCNMGGADIVSPYMMSSVKYTELSLPVSDNDRKKILLVDDDADVIHYMKELLAPYYDVQSRFDADSAYTLMKEEAFDVVISDVVMPGKNGYELCCQIKDNIQISHIPVILLTAKATVEDQVQGLDCGADAYVTKPFEPQYLLALISSQLKNREKLRALLSEATDMDNLEENVLSPQDNAFMSELYQLMEKELSNTELDVARMTEMLHISRTKFYYKVKGLTGENPSVFFKRYKLNRAAQLLGERKYNVSEIADMTGFSTLSHFSTSFKKQFGVSPSEYIK